MRVHDLKILNDFADSVVAGDKTFEIRENDRGFQKGDFIKFQAIDKTGCNNVRYVADSGYGVIVLFVV